jgi:hypothetical protein
MRSPRPDRSTAARAVDRSGHRVEAPAGVQSREPQRDVGRTAPEIDRQHVVREPGQPRVNVFAERRVGVLEVGAGVRERLGLVVHQLGLGRALHRGGGVCRAALSGARMRELRHRCKRFEYPAA